MESSGSGSFLRNRRLGSFLDTNSGPNMRETRKISSKEGARQRSKTDDDDDGWICSLISCVRIVTCFLTMMVTTFIWALIMLLLLPWPSQRIRQGNIYGHVTGRLLMLILILEENPTADNIIANRAEISWTIKNFSGSVEVSRIIQKCWRELEELSIGPLVYNTWDRFIKRISNCNNLSGLHIFGSPFSSEPGFSHFLLDEYTASVITRHLLQLRVFNIDESKLHKSGVSTLLFDSKNLEELNLKLCHGVVAPPIAPIVAAPFKLLKKPVTVEIERVKNCKKTWFTCSSRVMLLCTAEDLVNQLWTGDVLELKS